MVFLVAAFIAFLMDVFFFIISCLYGRADATEVVRQENLELRRMIMELRNIVSENQQQLNALVGRNVVMERRIRNFLDMPPSYETLTPLRPTPALSSLPTATPASTPATSTNADNSERHTTPRRRNRLSNLVRRFRR